jgi:hypothetical protein
VYWRVLPLFGIRYWHVYFYYYGAYMYTDKWGLLSAFFLMVSGLRLAAILGVFLAFIALCWRRRICVDHAFIFHFVWAFSFFLTVILKNRWPCKFFLLPPICVCIVELLPKVRGLYSRVYCLNALVRCWVGRLNELRFTCLWALVLHG